ncbi:MAG: methionine ABC transporter permease [Culicoidibacterales bacterium]
MRVPLEKFWEATLDTLYMSSVSFVISSILAIALGLFLYLSRKDGLYPKPLSYSIASTAINFLRSTPFIILMLILVPVTRAIIGTAIGTNAVIIALIFSGTPYMARLAEISFLEINDGVIEAAQSMGVSTLALIRYFLLPESASTLISNLTVAAIGLIGSTAVAGIIGGGGLGDLAIQFGYGRFDDQTMFLSVGILIVIVQIVQFVGVILAKRAKRL